MAEAQADAPAPKSFAEAQAAKREETEREYKARLDPVRAENERMTAKAREHGLV